MTGIKNIQQQFPFTNIESNKYWPYILWSMVVILFVTGIAANSIWTTHESYYAVAVQEMLERGNFWDITFNGELRLNKPPLTYWLMAGSAMLLGVHEWSLRLPIMLLGLGTILIVYQLAKLLYNHRVAYLAMLMMAVSLQFVWLKHYASPEVPLTFFFTLTIYLFVKAFKEQRGPLSLLAFLSLGLTVLTKGYPYFIIIGSILLTYLFVQGNYSLQEVKKKLSILHWKIGSLISLGVGMSWILVMLYRYPEKMVQVLHFETTARAFENSTVVGALGNLFFYPEVILWSFLPFSLAFYLVVFHYIKYYRNTKEVALSVSWLVVMLVIFTLAKGKLPAYFIQAHPAMSLLLAYFVVYHQPKRLVKLWQLSFLLPSFLLIAACFAMVFLFHLSPAWYIVTIAIAGAMVYGLNRLKWRVLPYYAFFTMYLTLLIMFSGMYPALERYRPYKAISAAIQAEQIESSVPLVIEERFIHNLPFYAKRKVLRNREYSLADILRMGQQQEVLALIKAGNGAIPAGYKVLWEGSLYKRGSESHGFKFALACWRAKEGDMQKFQKYSLIHRQDFTKKYKAHYHSASFK